MVQDGKRVEPPEKRRGARSGGNKFHNQASLFTVDCRSIAEWARLAAATDRVGERGGMNAPGRPAKFSTS